MLNWLYNLLLLFSGILLLLKNFSLQRLGLSIPKVKPDIWLHIASMGEMVGVKPFLDEARKLRLSFVISCMTKTGYQTAKGFGEEVFYLPLDFSFLMRRTIKKLLPKILIISETELWPNLIRSAKKNGCSVILINGRITEKSYRRYQVLSSLTKEVLSSFDLFLMQSEDDAERIRGLGASCDRVKVCGNTKFDWLATDVPSFDIDFATSKVIVFGSIREMEEEAIISAFSKIRREIPEVIGIIAPRHLERVKAISERLIEAKIPFAKRTEKSKKIQAGSILLLDTIGELRQAYKSSSLSFVGGTLADYGGHNLLEPALFGIPVLFGIYTSHFKDVAIAMKKEKAAIEVRNEKELAKNAARLLSCEEERVLMGKRAVEVAQKFVGASTRMLSEISISK
ncbi:MAG: glycosyltransferase N-terminal domain-containing protein [bacterium]|nr:glycosyltransferase N-terminal domain-containing protein [bacterium]